MKARAVWNMTKKVCFFAFICFGAFFFAATSGAIYALAGLHWLSVAFFAMGLFSCAAGLHDLFFWNHLDRKFPIR